MLADDGSPQGADADGGPLIGEPLSHYRILHELGTGGMGVVYKAEDLRLGRLVALKFLPPWLSRDAAAKARFVQEARTASALDHPSICTIYDIDETADGRVFLAMAFYDGETLKARLTRGALPLADALRIAAGIAEGLARAHEHGIIHRDIKPANLMITSQGMVKILDFGVAKLADSPALTATGVSVGTPAYMSPEQARGEPLDARTDIWSLGAVLYEMLAGCPPFAGETSVGVLQSILHDDPRPLEPQRPGVPEQVTTIVRRMLTKTRGSRYGTAAEVLEDLRSTGLVAIDRSTGSRPPERPGERRRIAAPIVWAGMAGLVLLVLGVLAVVAPWRRETATSSARSAVTASDNAPQVDDRKRIVVLPFENLGASDDAYFADGMTEEITSRLAVVSGLAVISRTSAVQYNRTGKTLRQIGEDLRVDYVLEGTVRWARGSDGSRVRITPQLVRVSDDTHVWTHRYDATLEDVFKVQSDIAERVTGSLEVALESGERQRLETRPTENLEAYHAYLKGIYHRQQPSDDNAQAEAIRSFEQAVAQDPGFALAWSELSLVRSARYNTGVDRSPKAREQALEGARMALRLKPDLTKAHLALASYRYQIERDYEAALAEVETARQQLPNSSEVLELLGIIQRRQGRWEASSANLSRALELDPRSPRIVDGLAINCMSTRNYPKAVEYFEQTRALDPMRPFYVGEAWTQFTWRKDLARARQILESAPRIDERVPSLLSRFELFDGRYDRALELIRSIPSGRTWWPTNFRFPAQLAEAHVLDAMGRAAEARERYGAAATILRREQPDRGEDYQVEAALGLAYAGLGRAGEAVRHGRRAVELIPVTTDAHEAPVYLYVLAHIHAQLGQVDAALTELDAMLSAPGFYNIVWVEHDPAFARVRADERFRKLQAKFGGQTS
ncbi:MAG TPA: protein kinase [Vicinamibacterales bacterium]|nr:protein kinase [Vicinamibacterales bacterium]